MRYKDKLPIWKRGRKRRKKGRKELSLTFLGGEETLPDGGRETYGFRGEGSRDLRDDRSTKLF